MKFDDGKAVAALIDFAKATPTFTGEEALAFAESVVGVIPPQSKGPVFRRALIHNKFVVEIGREVSARKEAHSRTVARYKSKLCADRHELMPIIEQLAALRSQVLTRQLSLDDALSKAYSMGAQAVAV